MTSVSYSAVKSRNRPCESTGGGYIFGGIMSEVIENVEGSGIPVLSAGNTVENLAGVDRDAATGVVTVDLSEVSTEQSEVTAPNASASDTATIDPSVETITAEEYLDEENTFDVSRAEFSELRDLVLSLAQGIQTFNQGSPHKIPVVSINATLGIK